MVKIDLLPRENEKAPILYHDVKPMQCFRWADLDHSLLHIKLRQQAYIVLDTGEWEQRYMIEGSNPPVTLVGRLVAVTVTQEYTDCGG